MTYGLDTWYTPPRKEVGRKRNTGSVRALKEFQKLQRIATLDITGALRTSPTDLLDLHAGLLPMDLLLKKICHRSSVRLCTLPSSNLASQQLNHYMRHPAKKFITNTQHMLNIFDLNPKRIEKITPFSHFVSQLLPFTTHLSASKEELVEQEAADNSVIQVYADSSRLDGNVGAAAVLFRTQSVNPDKTLWFKLGSDRDYSVKDAEAVGCVLAFWLLKDENQLSISPISIYTDSQSLFSHSKIGELNLAHTSRISS